MGVVGDPANRLRQMLADCVPFRTWCSAANAAEALTKIHFDALPAPEEPDETDAYTEEDFAGQRPYALIYPDEATPQLMTRDSSPNCWNYSGSLIVILSKTYDEIENGTPTEVFVQLAQEIDAICSNDSDSEPGLQQLATRPGYIGIKQIEIHWQGRTPPEHRNAYGDAYDVLLRIMWGSD
jgi:hypothetical protein